jgi:protein-S-isoprenylcysteine O-methyltransferase Ste14
MAVDSSLVTPEVQVPDASMNPFRLPLPPQPVATTPTAEAFTAVPPAPPAARTRTALRARLDLPALILGGLILWFAAIHIQLWFAHPSQPVGLGMVLLEMVQGTLFFVRRRTPRRRQSMAALAATTIGSWGALAVRPAGAAYFHAPLLFGARAVFGVSGPWLALQLVGTLAAIVALSTLGRSFGLLPGNRGVRTGGAYRLVRHPAYAAYLLTDVGYLLENLSIWNIAVLGITLVAQLTRIRQEEAALSQDPAYRIYQARVRFRLVPGLF